jgi:hypothetical protein
MPDTKTGQIHFGSWDFDYDVRGFEGLSLLNGKYRGRPAFGVLSMPVIRVKYLKDGGLGDILRFLSEKLKKPLGAGPYADRIRWKLHPEYGLQRMPFRNNQYVGFRSYVHNGVQRMELSIYARIGAYHIYQTWHLGEDGWIFPRVWSKGLTINMDHWHHPYWRFDFDIDGQGSHSVFVRNFGSWSQYSTEVNDIKNPDPRADTVWFVRNDLTGAGAFVIPSRGQFDVNDGVADGFSRLDVGVRRYSAPEEVKPWNYQKSPTGDWDWQMDVGGLGFLNGESVSGTDVVFWYAAHMFHHAHEGNDHWGGSGPNIKFDFDLPPREPPRDFGILVNILRHQMGNDTTVKGRGFTPGGPAVITFNGIPNRAPITRHATADGNGKFVLTEPFGFTSLNRDDAFKTVTIYGFDVTSGLMDSWTGNAAPWVAP